MTGGGKATAVENVIAQITLDAAAQAVSGHITDELAEVLTAARGNGIEAVGGRWVRDVSFWSRVALRARLAVCDTNTNGAPVLALTDAGRRAVTNVWAKRVLTESLRMAAARRQGREQAEWEARIVAEAQAAARHHNRTRRAARTAVGVLTLLTAGYALAVFTLPHIGH